MLEDGLHTVRLDLAGVGLRRIMLDEKDAAVGRGDQGQVELFVKGKGIHQLKMDLVTPLNSTAAQQILDFRIPVVAATRFRMTVPGDVEVKSGMKVVERVYDSATSQTHFELLPAHEKSTIVMSLNSHLLRQDRVVVSRAVLVDEATQNDERLYATFSLSVLHRAVDSFQVAVPAGFEIVHVNTPLLARWSVIADEPNHRQILKVHLREQTTQTVVLNVMAIRPNPPDNRWTFPSIKALEVIGEMAVIGLLLENRLQAQTIRSEALIPIDTSLLSQALPASVFQSEPGAPRVRPIVAYYAPQSTYQFAADFVKPPPRLRVSTNLLLTVTEKNQRIRGGFSLLPEIEQLFAVSFSLPQGWQVTDVTAGDGNVLPFEQLAGRIHVRMPKGVPIGRIWQVRFQARHVPSGWLDNWTATNVQFPVFRVLEATTETGAIAVAVEDDLEVRPDVLKQLTPLDNREKETYGLMGVPGSLAYRFDAIPYDGTFTVERIKPRLTAQTYSFLTVMPDVLIAHYEVAYDVEQAKVHRLRLSLPDSTPETVSILGIDGVVFKEYASELVDHQRRWTILLAEARRDSVRLAIDFSAAVTNAGHPADDVAGGSCGGRCSPGGFRGGRG